MTTQQTTKSGRPNLRHQKAVEVQFNLSAQLPRHGGRISMQTQPGRLVKERGDLGRSRQQLAESLVWVATTAADDCELQLTTLDGRLIRSTELRPAGRLAKAIKSGLDEGEGGEHRYLAATIGRDADAGSIDMWLVSLVRQFGAERLARAEVQLLCGLPVNGASVSVSMGGELADNDLKLMRQQLVEALTWSGKRLPSRPRLVVKEGDRVIAQTMLIERPRDLTDMAQDEVETNVSIVLGEMNDWRAKTLAPEQPIQANIDEWLSRCVKDFGRKKSL